MSKYFTFKTGKSAGKSIEQVAAEDYCRLLWVLNNTLRNADNAFKKRAEEVAYKLDNFVPAVKCKADGCEETARNISIVLSLPHGISVSTSYVYCEKQECLDTIIYEKAGVYPIKFGILEAFPAFPRWVRRDISKVLLECAGAPKRKTKEACKKWIDSLVID